MQGCPFECRELKAVLQAGDDNRWPLQRFGYIGDLLSGKVTGDAMLKRLEEAFPSFDDIRDATSKASLLYRTFMAFNLARGGADWAGAVRSPKEAQEDHHIFPRDRLSNNRDQTEDKQLWSW